MLMHRPRTHKPGFDSVTLESLSKDDGNGNDDPTKQCSDWLNEEI